MDKAAVYELERKQKENRSGSGLYYYRPFDKEDENEDDTRDQFELERLQELHMFNR